jgi:hypothetical protein
MSKPFILATAAAIGLVAAPIAATAADRAAAPISGESALKGQGTLFFLAGIAVIALAVAFLPEDEPASP